jgi:son of sevenless-like protein
LGGPGDIVDDDDGEDQLTLEQIVLWATLPHVRDSESMETLLLTHRTFTDSLTIIRILRKRFFVPVPLNIRTDPQKAQEFRQTVQKSVHLKVIKNLRNWLKSFWDEDFANDEAIQLELRDWLLEMKKHGMETNYMDKLAGVVLNEFERYLANGNPKLGKPMKDYSSIEPNSKLQIKNLKAEDLADQITLMDFDIFARIEPRECLGQAWKQKNNQVLAPHVLAMIKQFNSLTLFVQMQILCEKNLSNRTKAINRVISMGYRFEMLHNFNSLCAVYSALNSAPIHRLKHAWQRVKNSNKEKLARFRDIFARDRNHRNLRNIMRDMVLPVIPHIGLFLQDLVFIDDGNEKMTDNKNLGRSSMINFNKCVRCADRINTIAHYQKHPYSVKENDSTQFLLVQEFKKLQEFTEDEIWDMSSTIKATDEKEDKKKNRIFSK